MNKFQDVLSELTYKKDQVEWLKKFSEKNKIFPKEIYHNSEYVYYGILCDVYLMLHTLLEKSD